jgi:hypothetical protein
MKHNSKKFLQCLVPCRHLQASSEAGKFGPRRANCKFFLATCKKTKYTGMSAASMFADDTNISTFGTSAVEIQDYTDMQRGQARFITYY